MKGLLIKDIKLMGVQRNFFITIIVMAIVIAYSMNNTSFIMGYLSLVIPMFVLSTISYDEFDNGNAFLFSLPISRKEYVTEKYCFGMLLGLASLVLSVILAFAMEFIQGTPDFAKVLLSVPFVFSAMAVFLSVLLPLQIKFGGEKSRFAILAIGGIALTIGYGIVKLLSFLGIDVEKAASAVSELHVGILIAGAVILTLSFVLLSIKISTAILQKKEF